MDFKHFSKVTKAFLVSLLVSLRSLHNLLVSKLWRYHIILLSELIFGFLDFLCLRMEILLYSAIIGDVFLKGKGTLPHCRIVNSFLSDEMLS